MDIQHWIALAILVLPMIAFGLTLLEHTSFMAKHAAWQAIVAGALDIVAQIETELKANPGANAQQLLGAGIAELRSVYVDAFAKLGGTGVPDMVLQLLFQRLASRLPANVNAALLQFLNGGSSGGASTVLGGTASMQVKRGAGFVRPVGAPGLAREAMVVRRSRGLVLWLLWPVSFLLCLVRRAIRPRPFPLTFGGDVLGHV